MLESLTADQLLAMLASGDPTIILFNLLAFVAGLAMHVWQKMRTESLTFRQYWDLYGFDSVASVSALAVSFISLIMFAPQAPLYAYFSLAYMGDAMLNHTVTQQEKNIVADMEHLGKTQKYRKLRKFLYAVAFVVILTFVIV